MNENYLIIQNDVVTNICLWNGDTNVWTPPENSIWMPQSTTKTKIWQLINNAPELIVSIGNSSIGFSWDGEFCITNDPPPKPITAAENQPIASGVQNI